MKKLITLVEAQKELHGCEFVESRIAGLYLLEVKVVRYTPGARSGKFHHYETFLMPSETFKLWRAHVDNLARTAKSPSHERD